MNDDNIKKKKRRVEQIALEIEEKQAQFDQLVEEGKKILKLSEQEYNNNIHVAEIKLTKSRKNIILEAGKYLENNLEIVKNNDPHQICKMLKDKYKGILNPTAIWYHCPEGWKVSGRVSTGRKGGLSTQRLSNSSIEDTKPLTEYEQKYVDLHEEKVNRNKYIVALIDDFLGLTESEKTVIFGKVKRSGSEFHNALIDEAYNNMLRIVKSLNDADIPALLADIRLLKQILTKVADMALDEHEQRKRNKEMIKE